MVKSIMTLGQIIDTLQRKSPEAFVFFDFVYFRPTTLASYRGYYEQLALGYTDDMGQTFVHEVLENCIKATGATFTGWKGGDFTMHQDTQVWVANPGESGSTGIVDIVEDSPFIIFKTERFNF